jgi:hypothetical protein
MVAAYLRGLLKPQHQYGLRSAITENVVLEALACENLVRALEQEVSLFNAMIPVIDRKKLPGEIGASAYKMARINELRSLDIYRVAEQLASAGAAPSSSGGKISLLQAFRAFEAQGAFKKFEENFDESKLKPLL